MYFVKNLIHKFLNQQVSIIYNERFQKYLNTPKGVFWNSTLSQDLRLNIILDKIIKKSKSNKVSLADVGCGYGRLFEIIIERNLVNKIEYYGFDINNELKVIVSRITINIKTSFTLTHENHLFKISILTDVQNILFSIGLKLSEYKYTINIITK